MREIEISVIFFLQSLGPIVQTLMRIITNLGAAPVYILIVPAIYWCVDVLVGLQAGLILLSSVSSNAFFKMLFKAPRPYWISDAVKPLVHETSFGIPSGHAMNSISFGGWLAVKAKQKSFTIVYFTAVFLIGISRLMLGAHFLTDVLAGWLLGGLLLFGFMRLQPAFTRWFDSLTLDLQILLAFLSSSILFLPSLLVKALSASWSMPAEWAARAGNVELFSLEGPLLTAGVWFGMLAGFSILRKSHGLFQSQKGGWQKIVRYLVGLIGLILIYLVQSVLLPKGPGLLSTVLSYLVYALLGLWISALAPLLFVKLKIGTIQKETRFEA